MSLLYKSKEEQKFELNIEILEDREVLFDFYSDCGKFGAIEMLASYKITPERLIFILDEADLKDEEFN